MKDPGSIAKNKLVLPSELNSKAPIALIKMFTVVASELQHGENRRDVR